MPRRFGLTRPISTWYIPTVASLQRVRVRGYSYWRIVESYRANGKPRLKVLAYLGKADDLLTRLKAADDLRVQSRSHGAIAAVHALAQELDIAGAIDRHLAASGRRDRHHPVFIHDPTRKAKPHDGLSAGRSLELACVGRTCHATSKMGFADWARTTTLGELASVDVDKLTSQHFWDQMDQIPIELIPLIEKEIVERAIKRFGLSIDTLLYDATNFFTFIASTNTRCEIPRRGKNKQKRNDLRQVGVALLCSRGEGIPLMHQVYGGQVPDARSFAATLPKIRQRLVELDRDLHAVTIIYDKGNVSKENQGAVDNGQVHYVASLTAASQRALVEEANTNFESVELDKEESVQAFRTQREIWDAQRTVVVLVSQRLQAGQLRGIEQHLSSATRWLDELAAILQRGRQRRDRAAIERDIERRLMGRQFLGQILRVHLSEADHKLRLRYEVDKTALEALTKNWLGRQVLITDRHDWSTAEIIGAYRGQADIEAAFEHVKNPVHVMLRPQYHWTDQKLHVHVFSCVMSYMLGQLLFLKARRAGGSTRSMEHLLDTLAKVRRAKIIRFAGKKGLRVVTRIEEMPSEVARLAGAVGLQL